MKIRVLTTAVIVSVALALFLLEPCPVRASDLPSAAGDSVPSNLWLTRSLMEDLAVRCAAVLGPGQQRVLLEPLDQEPGTELFQAAVHSVLAGKGFQVYLAGADSLARPAADALWQYRVVGVELGYPRVGRTLGLWRSWIARELKVTVLCTITTLPEGRVLLDDQLQSRVEDRFDADEFAQVDSPLYDFTTAEPVAGSWHERLEEIVVLGTLAGLVAVYFANTSD